MLDLLITNGLIVDGTGNPGYRGAVGVEGERVRILRGNCSDIDAARTIDASNNVVCPGFIDIHSHSGLMALAEPRHEPKVRQGVTTELVGVDGNSYAPFNSHDELRRFVRLNSGLDGAPDLPELWTGVGEYLSMFDKGVAVNICYIIGNGPLRISAVGWDDRRATGPEMDRMKALLREGMEEGAFGLSTGLDYPPGIYADTAELVELCREAARLGGIYHSHLRYTLGDGFLDPIREAIEIGREGGLPSHLTHLYQRTGHHPSAQRMLELVEGARAESLDVTFDAYPNLWSSTRLLIIIPRWAHDGGPEKLKEVLGSPDARERLRREVRPRGSSWEEMWLTYFAKPHNRGYEGRSVAEIANMMGKGEVDALCDLLVDEDLQVSFVGAGPNMSTLPQFFQHPLSMVGSDGLLIGEYPSPRSYGTFPTVLSEYVREERYLSLENAIRKMTSFPAQRLGIPDRGVLRDGMRADITVFDPATVGTPSTKRDPRRFPTGIDYVIVNGVPVIDGGEHTGALPGRAIRRGAQST